MLRWTVFQFAVVIILISGPLQAKEIGSGFCTELQLENIPLVRIGETLHLPMEEMRITQEYNNSYQDGWCENGSAQPPATSAECQGKKIFYGHDGLDLHPQGAGSGQENILAVQNSLVLASHKSGTFDGWGESMILVTRSNEFSEELITFHYHHLHGTPSPSYSTTRLFNACEPVLKGQVIAKEGGTPGWPTHLHFSVKRWKNLSELQNEISHHPSGVYGYGYTYGDESKLARYLDPQALLYDFFTEFQEDQAEFSTWQWSQTYVTEMRHQGWYLGEFNGNYGVERNVARRAAARWIKQALELPTANSSASSLYYDVPPADPDFPYINTLARQDLTVPVLNPDGGCTTFGHYFCPDQDLSRSQAVKMIVAGFFQEEFLDIYNNWVWKAAAPLANNILSQFQDVSVYTWFAPYVYFAWQKGLTGTGSFFYPDQSVRRAELAKWLVMAWQIKHGQAPGFCRNVSCEGGYFCEESSKSCQPLPECIPWENSPCPLGGGYEIPGNTENGTGGNQGSGGNSSGGTGNSAGSGAMGNIYNCTSDPHYATPCSMGVGICLRGGIQVCNQIGDGLICSSSAGTPNPAGEICGNLMDDNCNGAADEPPCVQQGGSGGTSGAGGSGGSIPCTDGYYVSPSGASCYSNPSASGSPTLCLETSYSSGAQLSWRLCKQGGAFQNNFTYELLDQNHLSHYLGGTQNAGAGSACSPWQSADFSYITQNQPVNGAGLIVEVHSPNGCTQPSCTYYTGITTFYRDCL